MTNDEIARYSRQIILPNFGVTGQLKLKNGSVLIVGAGGLGCPSSLYLVGAGVGKLGIVDYDDVEMNNLHRQLLFKERDIGQPKAVAAANSLHELNSRTEIVTYCVQLSSENALKIIDEYDVVVDATDNVATRYLLNDACVLAKKPLVSGSALQLEGQLTVYNYRDGPCYRCLYPTPPPPEAVTNCGDGGVIGAVTGVIGALQAIETIKIILGQGEGIMASRLLLFDGETCSFRNVKLRGKNVKCNVCSSTPTITALIDYEQFCGSKATDKDSHLSLLTKDERIMVTDYKRLVYERQHHVLIDVRSPNEFEICHIGNSINIPIKVFQSEKTASTVIDEVAQKDCPVYVVCRRGNDSQIVAKLLKEKLGNTGHDVKDLVGGLHSWARNVDKDFPVY